MGFIEIEYPKTRYNALFKDLWVGEIFETGLLENSLLYIKIEIVDQRHDGLMNAVCLRSGKVTYFNDEDIVFRQSAILKVTALNKKGENKDD